jgi:hypothetical protein
MMSATTLPPHVTCSEFCGKPIFDALTDHDPSCGAPLAERKRLEGELKAVKLRAAADESSDDDEIEYQCSCDRGVPFDSEDDLRAHQAETGHVGAWTFNATTGKEVEIEVDGARAKLRTGPAREAIPDKPPWADPVVLPEYIYAAQQAIDDSAHMLGGMSAGKKCPGKRVISGIEIECPHITAVRTVRTNTCDLEHKHTETLMQVCLVHAILLFGAGIPVAGSGPLFDS